MVRVPTMQGVENAVATIDLFADRWTLLVTFYLSRDGVLRFSELEKAIGTISPKMLTQTLRRMERNGLVERKAYAVIPPKVEYSLTPLGISLSAPLLVLCDWSGKHYAEVIAAQDRYDAHAQQVVVEQ